MIRITGGVFRGRSIRTPSQDQTRPTQSKLRQALFNSLQAHVSDARVLDLFAGSGALGFEALSRGALEVTFVEKAGSVVRLIEENAESLDVKNQVHVVGSPVESVIERLRPRAPFDLIFADPPYGGGWELRLLNTWPWQDLLSPGGHLCLEWGTQKSRVSEVPERVPFLVKVREKNYGDSVLTTYVREPVE